MSFVNAIANPPETLRTLRARPVVFVVDDDPAVRESLESLIGAAGWTRAGLCLGGRVSGAAEAYVQPVVSCST